MYLVSVPSLPVRDCFSLTMFIVLANIVTSCSRLVQTNATLYRPAECMTLATAQTDTVELCICLSILKQETMKQAHIAYRSEQKVLLTVWW